MSLDASTTADGERVYIDRGQAERGAEGPFYFVFVDADARDRWGFACGGCGSLDTAMDTTGADPVYRLRQHPKTGEWDAAHE